MNLAGEDGTLANRSAGIEQRHDLHLVGKAGLLSYRKSPGNKHIYQGRNLTDPKERLACRQPHLGEFRLQDGQVVRIEKIKGLPHILIRNRSLHYRLPFPFSKLLFFSSITFIRPANLSVRRIDLNCSR